MQTNKTLIFDKNADNIFKKGDYVNSYMVIDLKSVNLNFQIEEQNATNYNLIATLTDTNNNPIPNNIIEFYKTINDDNCVIDFESDKEFVRNNQICILTATVTQNNNPLENILVQFYNDDILIGESITNEDGQALFEYVGYGTDDVIITAKSDNIISNSVNLGNYSDVTKNIKLDDTNNIVQIDDTLALTVRILDEYQQPYENLSVSFIQKNKQLFTNSCKSGVTDIDQWVAQSGSSVTRESDGSVFATTGSATGFIWANKIGTSTSSALGDYYGDCVVEMDILSTDGQYNGIMFYETSRTGAKVTIFYPPTNHSTGHYKIVKTGNNFKAYIDDIQVNDRDFVLEEPYRIGVRVENGGHNIKIANFSIVGDEPVYPLQFYDNELKTVTSTTTTVTVHDWNIHDIDMSNDCIIEWDMKTSNYGFAVLISNTFQASNNYFGVGVSTDNTIRGYYKTTTSSNINISSIWDYTTWHHCKLTKIEDVLAFVVDGVQIGTKSLANWTSLDSMQIFGDTWASGITCEAKNFVVKSKEEITTDMNGIATCNIVGDGNGLETYSAKLESVESEPIDIIDAAFVDIGTSANYNDNWFKRMGTQPYVTRQADGTLLEWTTSYHHYECQNGRQYTIPTVTEFDLVSTTAQTTFQQHDATANKTLNYNFNEETGHYKIVNTLKTTYVYLDGTLKNIYDLGQGKYYCAFITRQNGNYGLKYKNFVVYPIESKEEIIYENSTEVTKTNKSSSTIYDNNMSIQLPTNAEITFDIYSTNSTSGSEHRFFLLPKAQFNSGTTQPTEALFIDLLSSSKAQIGKRENNSTYHFVQNINATSSTYHTFKIVKTGTSIAFYLDGALITTQTVSWIDNHSDYCVSMMRWSASGTSSIKNVIIKKYNN